MNETVLVVDDEPDILMMVRHALRLAGYRVVEAETGEAAVEILERERPDAILLDLRLPGMDGWGVLGVARRLPSTADVPIVIMSAHATPSTRERAIEAGCAAYLTKPFTIEELTGAVETALGT